VIIYECDMCGKHSTCAYQSMKVPVHSRDGTPFDRLTKDLMLCQDCVDMLHEFVMNVRKSNDAEKEAKK